MSGKIKLNSASGGGSVSIQAPSSESNNRTLTLPSDADGTIVSKDASNNVAEVASINGGSIGTNNLVTNGAMIVAQRGVSSTANGYGTVDAMQCLYSGTDEAPTQEQVDVASGTTPYSLGFRKAFKITNGNQTSGAGAADYLAFDTKIEAQDIANSGWNYTSSSSFITLSFWIKSSVAQSFYGYIDVFDGTRHIYPIETGVLTANTWTKITKVIPGNSNLQFDNNEVVGFMFIMWPMIGTDYTDNSVSFNSWIPYVSGARFPDVTTTWYTTNDATLEFTGIQVEVGSTASSYAHKSYADTLAKCQRYLYKLEVGKGGGSTFNNFIVMARYSTGNASTPFGSIFFPVEMRTEPSFTFVGSALGSAGYAGNPVAYNEGKQMATIKGTNNVAAGGILYCRVGSSGDLDLFFSAEL